MKKLFIIALLSVVLSASAAGQGESSLKAKIKNLKDSEVSIKVTSLSGESKLLLDTIIDCPNGKFSFNNRFSEPAMVQFSIKSKTEAAETKLRATMSFTIYMIKGEHCTLEGSVNDNILLYSIKGSEMNSTLADYRTKYIDYDRYYDEMMAEKEYEKKVSISNLRQEVLKNRKAEQLEYIKTHLDSQISGIFLTMEEASIFNIYYPQISESVRNGIFKTSIEQMKLYYDAIANSSKVIVGAQSVDFTLKGLNGETVTLSSLRGKHVLIYFWGSWCGWCIKGFPKLNQFYEDTKDKVEFVGVVCHDTEKAFKGALAAHGPKWKNYMESDQVMAKYGVNAFPTKILIGPDGKILLRYDGDNAKFYEEALNYL